MAQDDHTTKNAPTDEQIAEALRDTAAEAVLAAAANELDRALEGGPMPLLRFSYPVDPYAESIRGVMLEGVEIFDTLGFELFARDAKGRRWRVWTHLAESSFDAELIEEEAAADERDYERGYERGFDEADDFIARHPHGMPISALIGAERVEEPEDDYERGERDGWEARMKEEGWPTSLADLAP